MKKYIKTIIMFMMVSGAVFANDDNEEKTGVFNFIPLVHYEYLSLDLQDVHSAGAGLIIDSENLLFVGIYSGYSFGEELSYDYPGLYHKLDCLLDGRIGRHQYIGIFKTQSDRPVSGGLSTYTSAAVYGYELIKKENFSFFLGAGAAVGDFGIEFSNGDSCPVIPVPLVRMKYASDLIETKFEFLTSPNFSFTLGPKSRVRLTGDFRMDQFRDERDIIFELALAYRFFSAEHEMGDFAGVSLGIKNDNYGAFMLGGENGDESVELHYYAAFASLDLSLLKITGGYAFEGRELYREEEKKDSGEGWFVSVQGLYQF